MSYTTARKAMTDRLKDYAGDPKIYAENQPGGDQTAPWARWSIRPAHTGDSDVGGLRQETVGTLWFQLFIPENTGTKAAEAFADKIGAFLNAKTVSSAAGQTVRFERALLRPAGKTDGYQQFAVTIAYREDAPAVNAA